MFTMMSNDIGIDLGTASILVYIRGKGVVLKEPSVVAIDRDTSRIMAIGEAARLMIGRTPGNIVAVRPLRQGVISDYTVTEKMMKYFIDKAVGKKTLRKPRISVCIPSGATEVERKPAKGDFFPILRAFVREADSSLHIWIRENGDEALREKILALEAIPWPELSADPWPEREHLASFCRMEGERLAAHGAVAGTSFTHKGERYFACGVAEVATHPDFQGRGYALSLLRRMNTDIQRRQADLCVFTCQPSLVPLYEKAGWTPCPDLCLTGGSAEKPFPSSSLGLTVMLSLLSPKAIAHGADFRNTAITLPLGENKLW